MNTNKILLGGIAGGIAMFFLGWLIYGIILADFMASNGNQCAARPMEEFIWWAMILSNIVGGILFAVIISWSNTSGALAGAKIGAIVGLLFGISIDASFYSMSTMISGITHMLVDVIAYTVMSALGAGVVGLVMGFGKK
ncbi:MAG: hypothetical protein EYC69_07135 [Bacteroidetes bacterium]|nr:MAG: hypothetical protein EYC69_07135 [Bacteroidota bacterium]